MYNNWNQTHPVVKPLASAPVVTPTQSPMNSARNLSLPPVRPVQPNSSPSSPPRSTPPRSRRTSRSSSTVSASPAGNTRPKPNQRLRLAQLEDVSYPVRFPYHSVPPYMRTDPLQYVPQPDDIQSRKYATSVDERNYLTVFEYQVNGQSVIWDYYTGYVHLTGIWKAIGNSKADIAKLLDISPQLEPVLRRVRGGYLKIQGTWLPYEVAYGLALRIAYHIRFSLVPLFGPNFPDQCLVPTDPRFGQLSLSTSSPTPSPTPPVHSPAVHTSLNQGNSQHTQYPSIVAPVRQHSLPGVHQIAAGAGAAIQQPRIDARRSFTVTGELPHPVDSFQSARRQSETDLHRRRRLSASLGQTIPRGRAFSAPHRSNSSHALPRHTLRGKPVEWAVGESSDDDEEDSPGVNAGMQGELQEMLRATRLLQELSMSQWTSNAPPINTHEKPHLPSLHAQLMQRPLGWDRS